MDSERRAHRRYPSRLPASLGIPGIGTLEVEIRDFSTGGFFLSYVSPLEVTPGLSVDTARGNLVDVRCILPGRSGTRELTCRGRLVRSGIHGIGVAFESTDQETFAALREYAGASSRAPEGDVASASASSACSPSDRAGDHAPGRSAATPPQGAGTATFGPAVRGVTPSAAAILTSCRARAEKVARALAEGFLAQASDRLRAAAERMPDFRERASCYGAAEVFAKQGAAFQRAFETAVQVALTRPRAKTRFAAGHDAFDPSTLSLVDRDEFDDWLACSAMARQVDLAFHDHLAPLDERIRLLTGAPSGNRDNPFAPTTFCEAFQRALAELGASRIARPPMFAAFRDLLHGSGDDEPLLGSFYRELNAFLAERGVLPQVTDVYSMVSKPAGTVRGDTDRSGRSGAHGTAEAGAPALVHAGPGRSGGGPARLQYASPGAGYGPGAATGAAPIAHQAVAAMPMVEAPAADGAAPAYYSQAELISALSRVNFAPAAAGAAEMQDPTTLQLFSLLATRATDAGDKQVGRRESEILKVTGALIDAMLEDRTLDDNARAWLKQLSIPLLKVAIRDDSLFGDDAHLARQLINNIASLDVDNESDSEGRRNAMRRNVDKMLAELTAAEEITSEMLARVVKRTGALLGLQRSTFKENVDELTSICQEFDQGDVLPAAPGTGGAGKADADQADHVARRPRVGDSVLLDTEGGQRRVKVAWITKDAQRYVFANAKGRKQATLTAAQLDRRLEDGTAVVLDHASDPLFDRAQQTALDKIYLQLLHESSHDQLTGLMNRRAFELRLGEVLTASRETGATPVMCYLNLDQFSVVNDAFGYGAGDQLLTEVSKLFSDALGERGTLARLGGDEFGILFTHVPVDDALVIVALQREAVQAYRLAHGGRTAAISFSAGVVAVAPGASDAAAVMHAAEASCRVARRKGRSYVHLYDPSDTELSREAQITRWATRIEGLLDDDQLSLRIQPIVSVADEGHAVHHSEVLLCVYDEDGNVVSPVEFIRTAEQLRRMPAVDRWVIERAFRWMADNPAKLDIVGGLAINLSGASMSEDGFADFILDKAREYNIPMHRVSFEATETAAIAHLANAVDLITRIKAAGSLFALDDFGSGLSSYAYLKNLAVDFLKIDGVFVKNMHDSTSDCAVVKSIVDIGHFLGKKVIAEAVESEVVLGMLRVLGVDYAQGYAVGMPRLLREV
ncbi:MAG: DUF1631 family protein [Casimicrobiaceae bacterium]